MAITYPRKIKDPEATLDYAVDWTAWLDSCADTIASVTWVIPTGITMTNQTQTPTIATVWLSGGSLTKVYRITCRMTTVGGRTEDFTFELCIEDK